MPADEQRGAMLTSAEGAVMTLLIAHGGLSAVQLKPLLDEHFGGPLRLSIGAIDAILVRLRERGLVGVR